MKFTIILEIETDRPKVEILSKTEKSTTMKMTNCNTIMGQLDAFVKGIGANVLELEVKEHA